MRKFIKWGLVVVAILVAAVVVYPFTVSDTETLELNDATRAAMPNESFVKLSAGYTHYEWCGPENGQPVVLVHGAGTPMIIWDYQFEALAQAGFHVLRYDFYGRGLSDRLSVYTADLYDRQLLELLDSQGIKTPVDLAGHSIGGAITIQFIDRHPERVRRFALFAPTGFPEQLPTRIVTLPLVGEWLVKVIGDRAIISGITRGIRNPEMKQIFMQKFLQQMKYKGTKQAVWAMARDHSYYELKSVYERVGKSGKPGILFWGTTDGEFKQHPLVQTAIPSIEFHAVNGASHQSIIDAPEAVNPLLIEFLKR